MANFSALFTIIEEKNCPLYRRGECLQLSEKTIACPGGSEVCLILVRDMTQILFEMLGNSEGPDGDLPLPVYNCSGCTGLIKFQLSSEDSDEETVVDAEFEIDPAKQSLLNQVSDIELFQHFSEEELIDVLQFFEEIEFTSDETLVKKGEINSNIYIVMAGELVVEDDGLPLAVLERGELCGEMSCLGPDISVSSVYARQNTKLLAIAGDVFSQVLGEFAFVQKYMTLLLAKRLRKTSEARERELESCMSGRLGQIAPAELMQVFHMHRKTGVLIFDLPSGEGTISFRNGEIVLAEFDTLSDRNAVFALLAEKKGTYRFTFGLSSEVMEIPEIGDFMGILMEGVQRIDEEDEEV
ncbi:MAG: hypothetical protein CSA20_08385 [Deltaproteobacteria bacterium]|nr:MAG: hypothetical protein CSA20_08385 [Deltaproteobacteria bacterium]